MTVFLFLIPFNKIELPKLTITNKRLTFKIIKIMI